MNFLDNLGSYDFENFLYKKFRVFRRDSDQNKFRPAYFPVSDEHNSDFRPYIYIDHKKIFTGNGTKNHKSLRPFEQRYIKNVKAANHK